MIPLKAARTLKSIAPSSLLTREGASKHRFNDFVSVFCQHTRRNDSKQRQFKNFFAKIALPFSTLPSEGYHVMENNKKRIKNNVSFIASNRKDRPYFERSVPDLLQSLFVFELCKLKVLVRNGERMLHHTRAILGRRFTDLLIRNTFFKQFCGGENHIEVSSKVKALNNIGVGAILDYAVEDEHCNGTTAKSSPLHDENNSSDQMPRQYDRRLSKFLQCIEVSRDSPNFRKFVAVKVTSLGSSYILQRMATFANEAKKTFTFFHEDEKGYLTRDEFSQVCRDSLIPSMDVYDAIQALDPHEMNAIDHIDLCSAAFGTSLSPPAARKLQGSNIFDKLVPNSVALSLEEQQQITDLYARLQKLVEEASSSGVCILIDAEQSWFQPAIDVITIQLQQTYNRSNITSHPIVFNTYQCYLRDTSERVKRHFIRSQCQGYHFGSKLVRGAYMQGENERAEKNMYPSPIHSSIEDTHNCYKEVLDYLMQHMATDGIGKATSEVMCATHNQDSIEYAIDMMDKLDLSKSIRDKIYFAQLYGMSDDITIPLSKMGYNVYKYLPYGEIHEVIPYMLRRAQENGDVLGKSNHEKQLIIDEFKARYKIL